MAMIKGKELKDEELEKVSGGIKATVTEIERGDVFIVVFGGSKGYGFIASEDCEITNINESIVHGYDIAQFSSGEWEIMGASYSTPADLLLGGLVYKYSEQLSNELKYLLD